MRAGRNGRAIAGALLGASAVLAVLVAAVVLSLSGGEAGAPGAGAPDRGTRGRAGTPLPVELESPSAARTAGGATASSPPVSAAFDGRGALRGELVAARGAAFPERWTLIVEPSPMLAGRERATSRRIEFERGERTFEVVDLPLAGYRVRAEAPASNSAPADVLLVASSPAAFVTLPFTAAGFVDGFVRCADGRAAEGLAVTLVSAATGASTRVECDVNGAWIQRDVRDGEYRLYFGTPESPLVAPREIAFRAPSLRVPETTLPEVSGLVMRVRDAVDALVPGAVITGTSAAGGAFAVTTDANGEARARYLRPGTWRLEARVESGGTANEHTSGRVTVELAPGPEQTCALRIPH